jgi:hypothetical protein
MNLNAKNAEKFSSICACTMMIKIMSFARIAGMARWKPGYPPFHQQAQAARLPLHRHALLRAASPEPEPRCGPQRKMQASKNRRPKCLVKSTVDLRLLTSLILDPIETAYVNPTQAGIQKKKQLCGCS